jgi:transcription antitermination factor NusG
VSDHERHRAIRSNHIARILEVKDQTRLVKELQNLQSVMALEEKVYPYDYLEKGQRVRIIEGPMQGLEGVVERKKTGFRLVLNVSSIFQAVAVDIDSDLVEPIVEPKFVNRIY